MGARLRQLWLTGILAALLAVAALPVPAEHARAMIERAAFAIAYAMPDGTLPVVCADAGGPTHGGERHLPTPACLACVILAAPGLPVPPAQLVRTAAATDADFAAAAALPQARAAATPQRARAPPPAVLA